MKPYTIHVDIERPRAEVVRIFADPKKLPLWQKGFQSLEHFAGEPGQTGAISRVVFLNGRQRIEMVERIVISALPDDLTAHYAWKGGENTLVSRFEELGPNRTRVTNTCEYTMRSTLLKGMGVVAPGLFKKQNQAFLDALKELCEGSSGPT